MATITLWKDRDKGIVDPFLFSEEAEKWAKNVGQEGGHNKNKSTQLRRFLDEILRINSKANIPDADWEMLLPQVHMIVAKVAYAKGRNLITDTYVDLIRGGVKQIEKKEDLQIFANFLDAFTGFYKIYHA